MKLSIIWCVEANNNIKKSIESLLDYVPLNSIEKLIIIGKTDDITIDGLQIEVLTGNNKVGLLNAAVSKIIKSDFIWLINGLFKVYEFNLNDLPDISSASEYKLDIKSWSASGDLKTGIEFTNFGLNRLYDSSRYSSCLSENNLLVRREILNELGSFDSKIVELIFTEYSLRYVKRYGKNLSFNDNKIAVSNESKLGIDEEYLIEKFFRKYRKYYKQFCTMSASRQADDLSLPDEYVSKHFDLKLYDLFSSASGKTVSIIFPGVSLDSVDDNWIYSSDVILGIDYVGLAFNCHYCLTKRVDVVSKLVNSGSYYINQMVLPYKLEDKMSGKIIINPFDDSIRYSTSDNSEGITPPFINADVDVLALHFALYLKPKKITLFGYDLDIRGDRSHTSRIEYYNDGNIWKRGEELNTILRRREHKLDLLGKIAEREGIKILRVGYA